MNITVPANAGVGFKGLRRIARNGLEKIIYRRLARVLTGFGALYIGLALSR